jgi:hypothetical protein
MTSIKEVVRWRILNEVVGEVQRDINNHASTLEDWKVLIVDDVTLPILSSCCKMFELAEANISCKWDKKTDAYVD